MTACLQQAPSCHVPAALAAGQLLRLAPSRAAKMSAQGLTATPPTTVNASLLSKTHLLSEGPCLGPHTGRGQRPAWPAPEQLPLPMPAKEAVPPAGGAGGKAPYAQPVAVRRCGSRAVAVQWHVIMCSPTCSLPNAATVSHT